MGGGEDPTEPAPRPDPFRQRGGPPLRPEGPRDPENTRHRPRPDGAPALPGPARPGRGLPGGPAPEAAGDASRARLPGALHPPARGLRAGPGGAGRRGRDPDRLRQDPLLQPARPRPHPEGPGRAGALPLPDEGARPGPAGGAARGDRGDRGRHRDVHLRRGHAAGRAEVDPGAGARRGDEPRHAPQGHPAAPHEVGEAAREPALRGGGRAAQPARGLRLARHEHPPAAAAALRVLRLAAAVHLLLGHDRQPEGAGRGPHRARDDARGPERAPRAASGTSRSTTRRS